MSDKVKKDSDVLEALFHDYAMEEPESRASLHQELQDHGIDLDAAVKRLSEHAARAIAAARRGLLEEAHRERIAAKDPTDTEKFSHLPKEAMLARLHQLQLQFRDQLQLEHRDLDSWSEEDLRSLLADFEDLATDGT